MHELCVHFDIFLGYLNLLKIMKFSTGIISMIDSLLARIEKILLKSDNIIGIYATYFGRYLKLETIFEDMTSLKIINWVAVLLQMPRKLLSVNYSS